MNWLDNVIAFFSPEAGARRAAWRINYEEMRSYDAGNGGRLNAGWGVTNQSAEMTDRAHRETVRARGRDLERNSDVMNSVLRAYRRNVIGSGYALQARTRSQKVNKELEKIWKKWCKARNCDVTGTQSLNQIMRMAVDRKRIDGGILFVKRYTSEGIVPFQLQMIEVDELDNLHTRPADEKNNRVVGGIEYNRYNKPIGYYIRQYEIDGFTVGQPVYIPAKDVIFYYTKKRPSQIREFPEVAPTISRVRDVNEFMTAVSVKERINACLSVFIKKALPVSGMGRSSTGSNQGPIREYNGKTLTPGMIHEMNAGDEVQVVNPTGQSADATTFVKMQTRLIGAGQGLSYEATSRDMSETNYASARQAGIEDDLTYEEEEECIIAILDEIYETFVISCALAGIISVKEFWENKEDYLEHEWTKAPKKWIDPLKESSATKTALNTGQKTFKQIAAENGKDWQQQIDDMAEVLEYGKKKGIDMGGVIFNGQLSEGKEEANEETPPGEETSKNPGASEKPGDGEGGSEEEGKE